MITKAIVFLSATYKGTYYGKITCTLTQLSLVYALGKIGRSLGDKPLVIFQFSLVLRLVIIAWKVRSKFLGKFALGHAPSRELSGTYCVLSTHTVILPYKIASAGAHIGHRICVLSYRLQL